MVHNSQLKAFARIHMVGVVKGLGVQPHGEPVGLSYFGALGDVPIMRVVSKHLVHVGQMVETGIERKLRLEHGAEPDIRAKKGQKVGGIRMEDLLLKRDLEEAALSYIKTK